MMDHRLSRFHHSLGRKQSAPGVTITSAASDPVSGAFPITVTFDEAVTGFALGDLSVGNGAASNFAGSGTTYTADITPGADGTVTLDVAAGVAQDAAGNDNTAATQFSVTADVSAPTAAITSSAADPVAGTFSVDVTFSESITGFVLGDLTVSNGSASNLTGSGASYSVNITPSGDGLVTVDVATGVAQDAAGNDNTAAAQFSITADVSAPAVEIVLPGETTTGALTASFEFSEPVSGFELTDISVSNGAASALLGSDASYTVLITPQAPGTVAVNVAPGAAADAAGNESVAGAAQIEPVAEAQAITLALGSSVPDPGTVAATAMITNPGSDPLSFDAAADVEWLDVSPASGTVPSLGALDIEISLNEAAGALQPGDYVGRVTVTVGGNALTTATATARATAGTVLLEIPVSLEVQTRIGAIVLVATTPSGTSGEASFSCSSDIATFDALTLMTSGGRASASASGLLPGVYSITQVSPAGWQVESIACAGDLDGGSSFDVQAGTVSIDLDVNESLVCTFANARDEDAVRLATKRALRDFMARRADRIVAAAPDLSRRFDERNTRERGAFAADMDGSGRYQMSFAGSLSGLRNAAATNTPAIIGVTDYQRPFLEGWDVWFAAELSGVSDDRAGEDAESDFGVAQLGVDHRLSEGLIVGLLAQYDWMEDVSADVFEETGATAGARVEGEGWMAGPYGVWRIRDSLVLDALALYGWSNNTVDPLGLYEDAFETDRFMLRAKLTGEFVSASGAWRLRPQAGLTHFEERQDGYVDSLEIAIPGHTVSLGRLRAGPQFAWRHAGDRAGWLELTAALNAVWDYQTAELFNQAGLLVGSDENLRADARFGLSTLGPWGAMIRLETGLSGLGVGDFEATSGRLEIRIPFGTGARSGGTSGTDLAAGRLSPGTACAGPAVSEHDLAFGSGYAGQCSDRGPIRH